MTFFNHVADLSDMASIVFFCATDSSMLLSIDGVVNEYFVPTIKVTAGKSLLQQLSEYITQGCIGNANVEIQQILRLYKIFVPIRNITIHHPIFQVSLSVDQKRRANSIIGKTTGKLRWTTESDLKKFHASNNLKSPELFDYFYKCLRNINYMINLPQEYQVSGNFFEMTDSVFALGRNTIFEQLVDAAGFGREIQETLFVEFLVMCSPAHFLNYQGFLTFISTFGWTKEEVPHLFRSADVHTRGALSFRELVYFLAAVEPGINFNGGPAELRCRYIFRYLDTDNNNLLKRDEMKKFFMILAKAWKQQKSNKVDEDLDKFYTSMKFAPDHDITMPEFLKACGELTLRGVSQIYRAGHSIHKFVKTAAEKISKRMVSDFSVGRAPSIYSTIGKTEDYELGLHLVKIQHKGTMIQIEELTNCPAAVSPSSIRVAQNESTKAYSVSQFNQNSLTNELLKAIRYLSHLNKKDNCYIKYENLNFSWGQLNFLNVANQILAVCENVKKLFLLEPRLIQASSPAYVMGDLHGNIFDLLNFEKVLWFMGPGLCPANMIFLGDYVDRGLFSIEVICYLFCYKIQNPKKIIMIRGNHEIRQVQMMFTFEREVKLKFGEKLGHILFAAINDVFDVMPLSVVIDGRIFCCHGGIPPPWICPLISAINDVPKLLNNPQEQSTLAWDLMWNDPVSRPVNAKLNMELAANQGFADNFKRGTAHVFSVEALERFLKTNNLTHMIRAHEVADFGFTLMQNAKLLTVFSTSHYCGRTNEAACVLTDHEKIRILKLAAD